MKHSAMLLLFLLPLLAGCKGEEVIGEDEFVEVYADLLIASDTSAVEDARKEVFGRHKVTRAQYEETVDYYNSNPAEWDRFFDKVIAHIESERKKNSSQSP